MLLFSQSQAFVRIESSTSERVWRECDEEALGFFRCYLWEHSNLKDYRRGRKRKHSARDPLLCIKSVFCLSWLKDKCAADSTLQEKKKALQEEVWSAAWIICRHRHRQSHDFRQWAWSQWSTKLSHLDTPSSFAPFSSPLFSPLLWVSSGAWMEVFIPGRTGGKNERTGNMEEGGEEGGRGGRSARVATRSTQCLFSPTSLFPPFSLHPPHPRLYPVLSAVDTKPC